MKRFVPLLLTLPVVRPVAAFVARPPTAVRCIRGPASARNGSGRRAKSFPAASGRKGAPSSTALSGFLPPSGGRGGIGPLATSLLTLGLTVAFFLSPLGLFVLGLFNSLLVLAILAPVVAVVGFNLWQYFSTVSAPCPCCGAPVTVLKRSRAAVLPNPTICFNCGSFIVASPDNTGIELEGPANMMDPTNSGFFNGIFSSPRVVARERPEVSLKKRVDSAKRFRREQTIIDVDVED